MAKKGIKPSPSSSPKGLLLLGASFLLLLCLFSYKGGQNHFNLLGMIGHFIAFSFYFTLGCGSFLFAFYLGWMGWKILTSKQKVSLKLKSIYFALFVFSICMLLNVAAETNLFNFSYLVEKVYSETLFIELPYPQRITRYHLGGMPLYYLLADLPHFNFQALFGNVGVFIIFSLLSLATFFLIFEIDLLNLFKKSKEFFAQKSSVSPKKELISKTFVEEVKIPKSLPVPKPVKKVFPLAEKKLKEEESPSLSLSQTKRSSNYILPPPSLLNNPSKIDHPTLKKDLRRLAEILEETLLSFGIEGKVGEIHAGPTITSFEIHPAIGVKVQKIKALENDIALNLQAKSIRIIAPIPGKAVVGVEIPSLYPQEVSFKEMLISYQSGKKCLIPVLLGKTVTGENVISDLAKMPHCLIAGATGSGKSVCINTIVMSIVMNASPDEIKLLMVDPKKVELSSYTRLPHLIAPVITEPRGAYTALNWLVKEMQLRYEILKQLGLRNIAAFNHRKIDTKLEASLSIPIPEQMPAIVAIIDEFADLMMASSSDLETPIARIAQMARAVGIHLILATQRPSREVITGIIKANIPTRIAFKVASRINSQIIIDETGADSLLGNGDLLFLPPGSSHLTRAQGVYISDEEINRVIDFIQNQMGPNYLIESFDHYTSELDASKSGEAPDALYQQALALVLETKNASTTFLQRKLKIGYARAASLIDALEERGIIGPQEGAKPRQILVSRSSQNNAS